MKHVIIGTAGHVDHGKTLLVKALTGIDTDRLKEEKKRGITIELGFAHIKFPNGRQAGIIDVPGHERFIKNMLAGAGGIDFAMLIVAADEGIMPQTVEHLGILSLLGISHGLVVITKCDTVEPDWIELIKEEIAAKVEGTFLQGAPMVTVSAYTGEGIDELRDMLSDMVERAGDKNAFAPARQPIDRVFSVDGFGTVVTGTLTDGQLSEGENVLLYPQQIETRVRNLQVHGATVERAYAGQRVAVNLAGLKRSDIERGMVIAKPGSVSVTLMLDVRLNLLKDAQRTLRSGTLLHLYHGAATVLCKIVLLDCDSLQPGQSALCQLRLTEPLAVRERDRFVVRFYSPLETIGGGIVLDAAPRRHKRNDSAVIEALKSRESGSERDRVLQAVALSGENYKPFSDKISELPMPEEHALSELAQLCELGEVCMYAQGRYLTRAQVDTIGQKAQALLSTFHEANPLSPGMKREELRQKLFGKLDIAAADGVLTLLSEGGIIEMVGQRICVSGFEIAFSQKHLKILAKAKEMFGQGGLTPPTIDELYAEFPKDKDSCKQVVDSMIASEQLIMCAPQVIFDGGVYRQALEQLRKHFEHNAELTLGELRDMLGTSRKYALALLEHWDRLKITIKNGDVRTYNGKI